MSATTVTITTTDAYQAVRCPNTRRLTVQTSNAAVRIGFGRGDPAQYRDPDETLLPTTGSLARDCDEVRLRSAARGVPAVVYLTAHPAGEET